jgi:hypothetical protein
MNYAKKRQIFSCETCDFVCSKSSDWERHNITSKHINRTTNGVIEHISSIKKKQDVKCNNCCTLYKSRSGLWNHMKKCAVIQENTTDTIVNQTDSCYEEPDIENKIEPIFYNGKDISNLKPEECSLDIIMHLIKQNEEFKQLMTEQNDEFKQIMVDQNKNIVEMMSHNQNITTNINSHNKTMNNQFNLNLFLNETCKDAMNINDFIDYVTVNLDDFENFGKVGYPKALGEIIVRNLNELDVKIRPIHCSDLKREVLHVKHDGVWHSDDSQKFIKRSITYVANKNIRQRPLWQDENPESKNCLTSTYERFNNICLASLGPATDEQEADFLKKITSTIAREVVIDKKKKY